MTKWKIISLTVLALLALNAHAWASVDDPFTDPRPAYRDYDWTFGTGYTLQATDNGKWYNIGLDPYAAQSAGDGTAYATPSSNYWTSVSGKLNGFSLSNSIGDWLYAIDVGIEATILYTIREDYSSTGDVANADIMEINAQEVETLIKHGYGAPDSLGITDVNDDVTALEWNTEFDAVNLVFQHCYAVQGSGGVYSPNVGVDRNQDDKTVYMTWGARAYFSGNNLYRTYRVNKSWDGTGNGFARADSIYITTNPDGYDEQLGNPTFDGTNWFLPVTVSGTTYSQRMDLPYNESGYPGNSGAVIQWYDDHALYLAGLIPDPGGPGVSGRYVLERDVFLKTSTGTRWAHAADVCYEARTYNPIRNDDGPESPYKWVYDDSGDMYTPDGTPPPGGWSNDPYGRAYELCGAHPEFPDDDTYGECESSIDCYIWKNQLEGVEGRGLLVDSWRLAGLMLGQEFWSDGYVWSGELGVVASRTWADEFIDLGWFTRIPTWSWDGSAWVLPTYYDKYDPASMGKHHIWDTVNKHTDTPVAGYDALNNFMRYVFDIDALVVEDADDDGEFDVGEDYILFSVVDDGLYHMYAEWGKSYGSVSTPFDGVYFDGDTIFLYDGTSVIPYFDVSAGIFFGQAISTTTGLGAATLWAMGDLGYDLDALDINVIPEPSTIFLMIGSGGLAMLAGIMRRKLR